MGFFQPATAFMMVAGWAGSHDVGPDMFATQMFGQDMIYGQV
jgi:hypothetical protein